MARIDPISFDEAAPAAQAEWERQVTAFGRMTQMKRTLAHSALALDVYMQWYPLRDAVEVFLGKRPTLLFAHAISTGTDCLICSTYFRRYLIDQGEDPDDLQLDDKEEVIVRLGRQIAKDPHGVSDELFAAVERYLSPDQIVTLIAFGGMMVATNIINNVIRVDLDTYLEPYRVREEA